MTKWIGPVLASLSLLIASPLLAATADNDSTALRAAIDGTQRSEQNRARDVYRHPLETLQFFGLRSTQTVVEVSPGSGWWTEILAPYLRDNGRYYAAGPNPAAASSEEQEYRRRFAAKLASDPTIYDKVIVTDFAPGKGDIAPPGSVDVVLTFRNVHNWLQNGTAEAAFVTFYRALKPGGVLGVEEHRAAADAPQDPQAKSGYVREDVVIALAEKAGFRLADRSEINANPKDTKSYPEGVWTLPPTLKLKDKDRDHYLSIGESDRATLKFIKPN